jgi:hypothetical protein
MFTAFVPGTVLGAAAELEVEVVVVLLLLALPPLAW